MICPQCRTNNPDTARFCMNCGYRFIQMNTNRAGTTPQGAVNVPPVPALAREVEGERRIVTILFCDVKGSTAMAERLDPEEWASIMQQVFTYLIGAVEHQGGTVGRLMGDAILAFFGAPTAHEDDPSRAVLTGLEIIESIQDYRDRIRQRYGLDFDVRVGINTGLVFVGEIGADTHSEYTALGDAINLAARMEQTAKPGTLQIAADTYKLVAPLFECESLGRIEVKGKQEPIATYRVLRTKAQPGSTRGIEGLHTPLVGRKTEFSQVQQALDALQNREGQIVYISGEAGLGKSRLIQELKTVWQQSSPEGHTWLESRGTLYDTVNPYELFRQLFKQLPSPEGSELAALTNNVDDKRVRTALEMLNRDVGNVNTGSNEQTEGEALKRQVFETALTLWRALASHHPIVLVFDDLHWADAASVELIVHCFQLVEEVPILFLCASRTEREAPGWQIRLDAENRYEQHLTEIVLAPLSRDESTALVDNLLAVPEMPDKLREEIAQKTEGNPLFVEEVVRSLMESGVKNAEISIPDSVQILLLARIDRLEREARQVLQHASVIGRSFYYRLLERIAQPADALADRLGLLEKADLIGKGTFEPELEYLFRHELVRDAAYNSILQRRRLDYHRQVGQAIEELFPERLEDEAHRLGYHFAQAQDQARAAKYYRLAGDQAYRLYANTEAADHYRHALAWTQKGDADPDQLMFLYTRLGRALELNAEYDLALTHYDEMDSYSRQINNRELELASLVARATIRTTANRAHDPLEGKRLLDRARVLAHDLGDRPTEAKILWNLMLLGNLSGGDSQERMEHGEQAMTLARELHLDELLAFILLDMWYTYGGTGNWSRALASLQESTALWKRLGNAPMLSESLNRTAITFMFTGDFARGQAIGDEAFEIGRLSNNIEAQSNARNMIGWSYVEQGDFKQAQALMEKGITLGEPSGNVSILMFTRADLGLTYGLLGAFDKGIAMAETALSASLAGIPVMAGWPGGILTRLYLLKGDVNSAKDTLKRLQGYTTYRQQVRFMVPAWAHLGLAEAELALLGGDYASALASADRLINDMRADGLKLFLADSLYIKGRALIGQGKTENARAAFVEGQNLADQIGSRQALWPILAALSEVDNSLGNLDAAQHLQVQATEIIHNIADHAPSPELRESFLALAPVQRVLVA